LYLSGAAMSAQTGLPDLGVLTIDDLCFFTRPVPRASGLPVLVDRDTGLGEALNVMQMVRAFEDAGAGAVQIEDRRALRDDRVPRYETLDAPIVRSLVPPGTPE
jgi:methylisocitrate lyase